MVNEPINATEYWFVKNIVEDFYDVPCKVVTIPSPFWRFGHVNIKIIETEVEEQAPLENLFHREREALDYCIKHNDEFSKCLEGIIQNVDVVIKGALTRIVQLELEPLGFEILPN